jgi:hypothetical protein
MSLNFFANIIRGTIKFTSVKSSGGGATINAVVEGLLCFRLAWYNIYIKLKSNFVSFLKNQTDGT